MNFSQIKCFLAAADCLSFTRAADRLYLSQPVLSRQIAAMEEELCIDLFVREKKSVRLTPAGEIMAAGLADIAESYKQLVEKAAAIHNGYAGSLNIGMIDGQLVCPPISTALTRFHKDYPDVCANLSKHTMAGLCRALDMGDIDIAFAAQSNIENFEDIEYQEVGLSPTMLVIPKNHPLAGKENLTMADFKNDTFLTLPESESPRISAIINRRIEATGEKLTTLEAPNIGVLALWLEAGYGIFPLNSNHSLRNNPNLLFIPMNELDYSIEVIMWKKTSKNPLIKMFAKEFDPWENPYKNK